MKQYRKTEIARLLGEPTRKIQFWLDSGIVVPDLVPPSGRGKAVIFSYRNLIEFGMVQILHRKYGLKLGEIKIILEVLRGEHADVVTDVDFADFYANRDWGSKRELIVIKTLPADPDGYSFLITLIDKKGIFRGPDGKEVGLSSILEPKKDNTALYSATIMLLGSIKNLAVEAFQEG